LSAHCTSFLYARQCVTIRHNFYHCCANQLSFEIALLSCSRSPDAPREVVDHASAARQGADELSPEEFQREVSRNTWVCPLLLLLLLQQPEMEVCSMQSTGRTPGEYC
jgi:hypothetical protein